MTMARRQADGSWMTLGTETLTEAVRDPVRRTFSYNMPSSGRFEVRAQRTSSAASATGASDRIQWSGAKAYLTEALSFSGLTTLAVRMRATNNLSQRASRKINLTATRKIPEWTPDGGWSAPQPSRSIIWAIADALRTSHYGAAWPDAQIDLVGMHAINQVHVSRGDQLNAVFDRRTSMWEALRLMGRVGRCACILQGGTFRVIRDRQQSLPSAMFSPRNIIKNSFSIQYQMASEDTVDGVSVEYINPITWKPAEVAVTETGATPLNAAKVKLFGCTSLAQARREALYLARNNVFRRKTIVFKTELEGYIPTFGDLVVVSHDMPSWGVSGDILGVSASGVITLSEPVSFSGSGEHYAAFRTRAGGLSGPWPVTATGHENELEISGSWIHNRDSVNGVSTFTRGSDVIRLYWGTQEERTHFSFGVGDSWRQLGIVKAIKPQGDLEVELSILAEDNRVHTD